MYEFQSLPRLRVAPVIPYSRLRSTTPDFSSVCSEEEVGDEGEEEDGALLVSAHYACAAADVPRTDVLSALVHHLRPSLLPSPCVFRRWLTAAPWIWAWPNPACRRAVCSGAFRWRVFVLARRVASLAWTRN